MVCKKYCLAGMLFILLAGLKTCWPQSALYSRIGMDTIEDRLRRYGDTDPERSKILKQLFEEAGCRDKHLRVQPVPDADAPNIICSLPGETGEIIIVGAHFDFVDKGEGVADNWSGASLLPSLFQSLSATTRRHTFVFIGFSDEEEGYIGSHFYVEQLKKDQLESIQAMINLDTLGLDSTKVWTSNSNPELVVLLNRVAASMQLPLDTMDVDDIGDSDGNSFSKRGIPIITLHSVTLGNLHILHSVDDTYNAIQMSDYYDTYKLVAAYLAILDQQELRLAPPEHEAISIEWSE